jgi:hypothetical protein
MKTLQQMDAELERLSKLHQRVWGEICQLQAERNIALQQLARQNARNEPLPAVQYSTWNDAVFRNDKTAEFEEIFHHE